MKIFSWMQEKLNGYQGSTKRNSLPAKHHLMHETCKEEFSDWPSGLLAIGTFGNNSTKDTDKFNFPGEECPISQEHQEEMSHEEVRELHKELKLLLKEQSRSADSDLVEDSKHNLPPEKFFDFLLSLEDERSTSELISDNLTSQEFHYQRSNGSVHRKDKNSHFHKKNKVSKRSFSFLLRKAFHLDKKLNPLLKDPHPEPKLEKSRLEKILRAILNKKIHPQSSTPKALMKKCLDNKHLSETDSEDEVIEETSEGSKWVKTDSDFIVLEI